MIQQAKIQNPKTPLDDKVSFQQILAAWFQKSCRDLPWRREVSVYPIVVSEFMLQQTQVETVLGYYANWLKAFPDFYTLASASEEEVLRQWEGLGYYTRARNLKKLATIVVQDFHGHFPENVEAMLKLPGIGQYTATAIASFAFNQPQATVDGNITRVLARLFNYRESVVFSQGQKTIWEFARKILPEKNAREHNSALMELGALVCLPKKPLCTACPVLNFCASHLDFPELLPLKKPAAQAIHIIEDCAFVTYRDKILLEQSKNSRWQGLWKFPPANTAEKKNLLLQSKYPVTRYRVTLRLFREDAPPHTDESQAWFDIFKLRRIPMPRPHRKALEQLLKHLK